MSPINFEEDAVTKLNQDELEDVASLLQRQLKAELDVEIAEVELDQKKRRAEKIIRRNNTCTND
jgi:hypothetical protein